MFEFSQLVLIAFALFLVYWYFSDDERILIQKQQNIHLRLNVKNASQLQIGTLPQIRVLHTLDLRTKWIPIILIHKNFFATLAKEKQYKQLFTTVMI